MQLRNVSQFDLFFAAPGLWKLFVQHAPLLHPFVRGPLGDRWQDEGAARLHGHRLAVERVLREQAEATEALRRAERLGVGFSQWREVMAMAARGAPAPRRDVLLKVIGHGAGSPRSIKESKDLLLKVKSRIGVHADEFVALGIAPPLLQLPERTLAALESGAAEVAREKAEVSHARADLAEIQDLLLETLEALWNAADIASRHALLLVQFDDATPEQKKAAQATADKAGELLVSLEKVLGEARVEAQRRAAVEPVPVEVLATGDTKAPAPAAEEEVKSA